MYSTTVSLLFVTNHCILHQLIDFLHFLFSSLSTDYDTRFETLIECFTKVGFTLPCALLWAHFSAVTGEKCADVCAAVATNNLSVVEGPPFCELTSCTACSAELMDSTLNRLAGIWKLAENAGFNAETPSNCSTFHSFDLNPCQGAPSTSAPIQSKEKDSAAKSAASYSHQWTSPCVAMTFMTTIAYLIVDLY
jgi:hypothetical protein